MELDRHETARRMRALRGYSLLGQAEFAEALGIEGKVAERYMRTSGATKTPETILRAAASVAGLPEDFAIGTFGAPGSGEAPLTEKDVRMIVQLELAATRDDDERPDAGHQAPGDQAS